MLADGLIDVGVEARLLGVERLCAIDVGDGYDDQFEPPIHGDRSYRAHVVETPPTSASAPPSSRSSCCCSSAAAGHAPDGPDDQAPRFRLSESANTCSRTISGEGKRVKTSLVNEPPLSISRSP